VKGLLVNLIDGDWKPVPVAAAQGMLPMSVRRPSSTSKAVLLKTGEKCR
jgi:hypothetical protein